MLSVEKKPISAQINLIFIEKLLLPCAKNASPHIAYYKNTRKT